jgi:hypothetical protein
VDKNPRTRCRPITALSQGLFNTLPNFIGLIYLCRLQTYVDKNPRTRCRPITALSQGRFKLQIDLDVVVRLPYYSSDGFSPSDGTAARPRASGGSGFKWVAGSRDKPSGTLWKRPGLCSTSKIKCESISYIQRARRPDVGL